MAEATITEISVEDIPLTVVSGTGKRRAKVFVRYTPSGASDTITLANYIPGVADVEGEEYVTVNNAVSATANTWSTTTITTASGAEAQAAEACYIVNFN